jgi:hypothetical protein
LCVNGALAAEPRRNSTLASIAESDDVGWVNDALRELRAGRTARVRPVGGSMRGRIESGQAVTISAVDPADVRAGDIVLVAWKGNHLLHLVKEAEADRLLIGNNVGKVNGWVPRHAVAGRVTDVGNESTAESPATPADVGRHICSSVDQFLGQHPHGNRKNWDDLRDRLLHWAQRLEPQTAFLGLVWVLENERRYQHQLMAAEILRRASLPCALTIGELLPRVLPRFEESAGAVPKYLADAFGKAEVLACLQTMAAGTGDPTLLGKIDTMRWWLNTAGSGTTTT